MSPSNTFGKFNDLRTLNKKFDIKSVKALPILDVCMGFQAGSFGTTYRQPQSDSLEDEIMRLSLKVGKQAYNLQT